MEDKPNLEALQALHGEKAIPEDVIQDLFGFSAPTENQLSNISTWATEAIRLKAEIEVVEQHLKGLNEELRIIEENKLPMALLAANMMEFKMKDGSKITIDDVIQGGFAKDVEKREFIFKWVVKEGGQETIKDHFEIDFTRGSYENAVALRMLLRAHKINFDEFENIHTQTFYAFLREKLREGTLPPFEEMGLRYFKKANIKLAKNGQ
jgi:hypothetical protein